MSTGTTARYGYCFILIDQHGYRAKETDAYCRAEDARRVSSLLDLRVSEVPNTDLAPLISCYGRMRSTITHEFASRITAAERNGHVAAANILRSQHQKSVPGQTEKLPRNAPR